MDVLQYKLIGNRKELNELFEDKVYRIHKYYYIYMTRYTDKIDYLMYILSYYATNDQLINCKYIIYNNLDLSTSYLVYGYNQKNIQYNITDQSRWNIVIQYNNNMYVVYYGPASIMFDLYGNVIKYSGNKSIQETIRGIIDTFKYTDIKFPKSLYN